VGLAGQLVTCARDVRSDVCAGGACFSGSSLARSYGMRRPANCGSTATALATARVGLLINRRLELSSGEGMQARARAGAAGGLIRPRQDRRRPFVASYAYHFSFGCASLEVLV
jgi:hypothetical protein